MKRCKFSRPARNLFYAGLCFLQAGACLTGYSQRSRGTDARDILLEQQAIHALTETLMRDITSPPVASRSYVYPMIAFYEAARPGAPSFKSFGGRLNGLGTAGADSMALPVPESGVEYDWMIAGAAAFHTTAYAFVFSKDLFQRLYDSVDQQIRRVHRGVPAGVYERSTKFGERVGRAVLAWSGKDGYGYTRTLERYTPAKDSATWKQTGPEYMEAVEPHWDKIRPMTLAAAHQFTIPEPAAYKSPAFVKEYMEVYEQSKHMTKDQEAFARFWDCNPYAVQTVGHLMYAVKKISPGGHWMGITSIAIRQHKASLIAALYSHSLVGIALFDGFIGAWDEKYKTNYLRPITAIQQLYEPTWEPLLQTPPFPEYPSAHSVISMASATVLTALYGDHFQYNDNAEKEFGLPDRHFHSFLEAANEAAMSRMYGGIHFREAVENGELMGKMIGEQIVQKLELGPLP